MRIETDWLIPQQKVIKYLFPTKILFPFSPISRCLWKFSSIFHIHFEWVKFPIPYTKNYNVALHKSNWIRRLWCSGVTYGEEKLETSRKFWNYIMLLLQQSRLIKKSKISICQSLHVGCHRHLISAPCNLSSLFPFGQQFQAQALMQCQKTVREAININCKIHSTHSTSLCFPRNSITSITKHQNSLSKMQLGFLFAIMSWRPPTTSTAARALRLFFHILFSLLST